MAVHGYTKNYKLIKPQFDTDTWHDYEYDNLDTIDAVLSAIFASGDWKGFWKTNTHYSAGGVVIDQATDTMYKIMVEHTSSAATFAEEQTAHPDYYELWSPNNLAESWAIKTDDKVSNTDYSAKAYAISSGLIAEGSAKEWAVGSGAIGNTNEYSAKKYATDAHNDYVSMTTNTNVVAVGSNINNVNAVGQSISSVNTVASNVASVNTVAGVSTDVTAVAGVASSVPTVANNSANVTTVATNISDVNTAATNIEAIKDALNQSAAASASASAALASQQQAEASATAALASEGKAHEYAVQAGRRNVGDVFLSNRSGDELNGAVECDGAVYQVADFAGENAVPALLAAGALPYISMAEHDLLINGDQTIEVVNGVVQDGGIVSAQYGGYFKPVGLSAVPFSTAESWEFETKLIYKNFGGTSARAIFASGELGDYKNPVLQCTTAGVVMIFLSSNGTSWNLANNVNSGLTLAEGTEYRLKFGFDGTTYYLKYKTPTDSDFTTKWSLAKTDKIVNAPSICLLNSLINASSPNTYWNGSQMSLPDTALTINGVEVWRGSTGRPAGVCPYFGWDGAGSTTFAVPKRIPRVLIASKKPSDGDQSWFNLYSDGWLEQGGYSTANSIHEFCRLQKAYRDTDYTVVTVSEGGSGDYIWSGVSATPKTVDSFQFSHRYNGRYVAYGYADVPEGMRVREMVQLVASASEQAVVTATSVLPRMNKLESRFQIVSVMPAEPDPDTFYYIVGE